MNEDTLAKKFSVVVLVLVLFILLVMVLLFPHASYSFGAAPAARLFLFPDVTLIDFSAYAPRSP